MSTIGLGAEIIEDACRRITMPMKEGRFTLQELRFIEKFLAAALGTTRRTIEKAEAKKAQPGEVNDV